ncbi:T9SS type A sorting domain-containing protein [Rufibacter latericius]|uniref:T9SS C-terminal target domain-containing protein n=1 Tax=Rufibacter latericius TaxID=2487040 RepID=A0A3M9N1D9_9BACT|nr:T9SS type A sorting domain-containing protein [Rufibacter latericius]RNI31590.1 T9SS C-terminal target domain-containing protein [Rufibacter latericius]
MKSVLQMILVGLVVFLQTAAYGQRTPIYHENFSGTLSNTAYRGGDFPWQLGSTSVNTDSYPKASRTDHLKTGKDAGAYVLEIGEFSTGGYEDIKVSWGGKTSGESSIKLEYSYNGGPYVPVTNWFEVGTEWSKVNAEQEIPLPACFNKGRVKLRWTYTVTNSSTTYAIDDITVTGIPYGGPNVPSATSTFNWYSRPVRETENPFTVVKYKSNNYYEQDGVLMQWDKEQFGSAAMYTQQTTYNYQGISFAIEQSLAGNTTSNNYTASKLYFTNKSVRGLTFTIYDVDRNSNQFLDILKVVAFKKGQSAPIYPQKNLVQTTSNNEFVVEGSTVLLKSKTQSNGGANIDNSSPEGDITVTFAETIDWVEIYYYNGANYSKVSHQGLAISDLSWRHTELPTPPVDFTTPSGPGDLGGTGPNPLPITLVSFEVKKVAEGARLTWATAAEKDNDRFVVERSVDGKTFEAIGEVKGAGNSNVLLKYSFLDRSPRTVVNYYRLTQHDYDGKAETHRTIYLVIKDNPATSLTLTTYPNPATDELTIKPSASSNEDQTFYLLNAAGSVVKTVVLPKHENALHLSVRDLASGLYLVKSGKAVSKFFKQ